MSDGQVAAADAGGRVLRRIGLLASPVLVLIGVVLALQTGGEGDAPPLEVSPHFVEPSDLTSLAATLGHDVFWAGERRPDRLELSEEADGSVYLRYLPAGVDAGDPRARFLTVGTYPVGAAASALRRTAAKAGTTLARGPAGSVVLANPSSRGSVYLAYPGSDLQVEVYDRAPGRALHLIRSGAIRPVG